MLAPDEGIGALHKACEEGNIEYVKMMLERKDIDVNLQSKVKKGEGMIHWNKESKTNHFF